MTIAIILAGGLGTRLRSVVPDLPKPMALVNGKPFLEHQIHYWHDQGIDEFVLSVGYKKEIIMDYFGASYKGIKISYAEEYSPLGTGGGLLLAFDLIGKDSGPVVVLNGDTYFEVNLPRMLAFHAEKNSTWSFGLFRSNEAGRYMGMDVDKEGKVIGLKSGSREIGCLANGGVYIVNPDFVDVLEYEMGEKLSLEDDILNALLTNNVSIYGCEIDGAFIDIGVPSDYQRASFILASERGEDAES